MLDGEGARSELPRAPSQGFGGLEQQLRHLGRRRLDRLYDWLLEADLGLKGSSQLPPRTLLERMVVQLARVNTNIPPASGVA